MININDISTNKCNRLTPGALGVGTDGGPVCNVGIHIQLLNQIVEEPVDEFDLLIDIFDTLAWKNLFQYSERFQKIKINYRVQLWRREQHPWRGMVLGSIGWWSGQAVSGQSWIIYSASPHDISDCTTMGPAWCSCMAQPQRACEILRPEDTKIIFN